mgnify:CR=1 FL=1
MKPSNLTGRYIISIDVGGTKIASALVSLEEGAAEHVHIVKTGARGGEYVLRQLYDIIARYLFLLGKDEVVGIGIDLPGIIDSSKGVAIYVPNIKGWSNFLLKDSLLSFLRNDMNIELPVLLLDDRVSVALGELWRGCAQGARNIVAVIVGTGVGAGIIIDGKPYLGSSWVSGALGWIALEKDPVSTEKGWLEEEISGSAIVRKVINACLKNGGCDNLKFISSNNLSDVTADQVFQAHDLGDPTIIQVLTSVARIMGIAIANIVSLLNPEVVVINGGVGIALMDRYGKEIERVVNIVAQPYATKRVVLCRSRLGYLANILGNAVPFRDPALMHYLSIL